jgi:hypothetical protein
LHFQGRGCINPGISREGGFRLWNSKRRGKSHMEFPEGGVNLVGGKFHGRAYIRG